MNERKEKPLSNNQMSSSKCGKNAELEKHYLANSIEMIDLGTDY